MNENKIQFDIVMWFNNSFCLKNDKQRGLIFAVPNGGTRNIKEAMVLKSTGVLAGVSDLIVILPNGKLIFVEVKKENGKQSDKQKDFEDRVNKLGYDYWLVYSLNDFKEIIKNDFRNTIPRQ